MESWKKRTGNSPSVGARTDMSRLVGHGMDEAVKLCSFIKSEVKMRLKKVCGFLGIPVTFLHFTRERFPGIL